MAKKALPSPEVLRQLLRYEPETGKLFWLPRPNGSPQWNGKFAGKETFTTISHGYPVGTIFNVRVSAHRVIWALQTGSWPVHEIDHVDRCRTNNRWVNLREATKTQNCHNASVRRDSASGVRCVSWDRQRKRWLVQVTADHKHHHIGRFKDLRQAEAAAIAARNRLHGEYAMVQG